MCVHRLSLVIAFAVLEATAVASPDTNCAITSPPKRSGESFDHAAMLRIFPRASEIPRNYTGCQSTWVVSGEISFLRGRVWLENGTPVRFVAPPTVENNGVECRYLRGKLVSVTGGGSADRCARPDSVVQPSMPSGCIEQIQKHPWSRKCAHDFENTNIINGRQ